MPARRALALVLFSLLVVPAAFADDAASPEGGEPAGGETTPAKAPKTVAAEKGRFAVLLELQGAFEPRGHQEVAFRGQVWGGELEVEEAVGLGPVQKDQILVRFKTEKIDRQIETAATDLRIAKATLEKQAAEVQRQGEATEIALAQGRTELRRAEEDLKLFVEVREPMRREQAEHGMKGTEYWLQDQVEELQQLEKMYSADDLTEETEEIVLKRTRRNLERSKKSFEFAKTNHRIAMEVELPRDREAVEMELRKERNQWERLDATARLVLEAAQLEYEKAKAGFARLEENLQKLRADRELFVLKAPAGGIAVPGTFAKGKWVGLDETARALRPGQDVKPEQVLYTIVTPGQLGLRSTVAEADLFRVKVDQTGTAVPTAASDLTFPVTVTRVAPVSTDGNYEVLLDLGRSDPRLMPGQGAKVKLQVDEKPDAITVPASAVVKDNGKHVVHVWADGKATPRAVKPGATSEGRTEITEGLAAGEVVVEKPQVPEKKDEKKDKKDEKKDGK